MSDLEKALECVIVEDDGVVHQCPHRGHQLAIVDAARRFASLTSPETIETIEWCERHDSPRIHDSVFCDYSLENEYCVTPCADIVKVAVLRSVEEGKT